MERVSVLICARNYGRYIGECLESVRTQTRTAEEIIVVDDGSTDNTCEIVKRFSGVQYIWQEGAGKAAAFNRGFAACTGDFVCHLDADDVWRPRKLEKVLPVVMGTKVGGVSHEVFNIDADGKRVSKVSRLRKAHFRHAGTLNLREVLLSLLVYPPAMPQRKRLGMPNTLVVRRDAVADAFPLPTSLGLSVDIALLLLAAREGLSYVPRKLAGYRWHGANYYLANRGRAAGEMLELASWADRLASTGRLECGLLGLLRAEWQAYNAMRRGGAWSAAVKAIGLPLSMMMAGILPSWKHWALPLGCIVGRLK